MKKTTEAIVIARCITMIAAVFSVVAYIIRKGTVRKTEELRKTIKEQNAIIGALNEKLMELTK